MAKKKRRSRKTAFQAKLKALGFKTYPAYLRSEHWTAFKEAYWKKHKKICFCCKEAASDLHHTTYEFLGSERQKDVKPMCRGCHDTIHKLIREHYVPLKTAHKVVALLLKD